MGLRKWCLLEENLIFADVRGILQVAKPCTVTLPGHKCSLSFGHYWVDGTPAFHTRTCTSPATPLHMRKGVAPNVHQVGLLPMSHNMAKIINPFLGMQERSGDWSERRFNPCWGTLQLAPFCCRSVYNILACVRQYLKVVRGGHASSRRQSREFAVRVVVQSVLFPWAVPDARRMTLARIAP